jgi:hypothetical protein
VLRVFGGISLLGAVVGFLGGAGQLPDAIYGIGLWLTPTAFVVWAVARLGTARFNEISGYGHEDEASDRGDPKRGNVEQWF